MIFRPVLRAQLAYVMRTSKTPGALYDPVLERRIDLGATSRAILERLDGERDVDTILDEVVAATGEARATVAHTLRALLLTNLVSGAGRSILSRAYRVCAGLDRFHPLHLPETRFACQGSGECCRNYAFGPLEGEDFERLQRLDLVGAMPHLAGAALFDMREWTEDAKMAFIVSVDDHCVFLLEDGRCGIHAHFGVEAKPSFCRAFPMRFQATIDGLKVCDQGECACFSRSAASGPPIAEQLPTLLSLRPAKVDLDHPLAMIDDATPCDFGHFLRLQTALCDLVGRRRGPAGPTLRAAGRLARRFLDGMASCPLDHGEPDWTAERILATPDDLLLGPPATDGERDRMDAVGVVMGALLRSVTPALSHARPSPYHQPSARLWREFASVAHLVHALAAHRADPESVPPIPEMEAIARLPCDGPEIEAAMRLSFRQQLFGPRMLIDGRPLPALLRLGASFLLTVFGARLRASYAAAPRVGLDHLDYGHVLAQRILRQATSAEVFTEHEDLGWDLLEAAPALAGA